MIDEGDCGAIGGIKIGTGKRSTPLYRLGNGYLLKNFGSHLYIVG
jgi:hypothetical protein